jgi:uncharacterized membrane protein YbhN (UPF0104 family)
MIPRLSESAEVPGVRRGAIASRALLIGLVTVLLAVVTFAVVDRWLPQVRANAGSITARPWHALLLAGCYFASHAANAATLYLMRTSTGRRIPVGTALALSLAGSFLNIAMPARIGTVYRVAMTARAGCVPLAESTTLNLLVALLGLAVAAALGALASLAVPGIGWAQRMLSAAIAIAIGLGIFVASRISAMDPTRSRIGAMLASAGTASRVLLRDRIGLAACVATSAAAAFSLAGAAWASFRLLGLAVPFSACLAIVPAGLLTLLVAVVPGGLGTREAGVVAAAALLGIPPSAATIAAILERIVMTLVLVIAGPVALVALLRAESRRGADSTRESIDKGRAHPVEERHQPTRNPGDD